MGIFIHKCTHKNVTLSARFSPEEHGIAGIMTVYMGKGTDANGLSNTLQLMSMHSERSFTHDHEFVHMSMAMPVARRSLTWTASPKCTRPQTVTQKRNALPF